MNSLVAVVLNLAAALIGYLISTARERLRARTLHNSVGWLWENTRYRRISIVIGQHSGGQPPGEIEPSINLIDALQRLSIGWTTC